MQWVPAAVLFDIHLQIQGGWAITWKLSEDHPDVSFSSPVMCKPLLHPASLS